MYIMTGISSIAMQRQIGWNSIFSMIVRSYCFCTYCTSAWTEFAQVLWELLLVFLLCNREKPYALTWE
jgi:hypothetical protein